jgi:hypothetical protein
MNGALFGAKFSATTPTRHQSPCAASASIAAAKGALLPVFWVVHDRDKRLHGAMKSAAPQELSGHAQVFGDVRDCGDALDNCREPASTTADS